MIRDVRHHHVRLTSSASVLILIAFGVAFTSLGLWSLLILMSTKPINHLIRSRSE